MFGCRNLELQLSTCVCSFPSQTPPMHSLTRREFIKGAAIGAAALSVPCSASAAQVDLEPIRAEVKKRHDESVGRLQQWIHQPSIAAENRGMNEGCELMLQMLS